MVTSLARAETHVARYAENQAARQIPMKMADWVERPDAFLEFNEYQILNDAGSVSADIARKLAEEQYDVFRVGQDREFESDFDREVKRIEQTRQPPKDNDDQTS